MNFRLITVGIADFQIAAPPDILRTILGSCVGVCLYDKINQIGGLAHIMLPRMNDMSSNLKKYADTAIPLLLNEMNKSGAELKLITAKIIGGATMFSITKVNSNRNIGQMNIAAVKNTLGELKIKIIAEELGGDYGRTIDFYMDTGMIKIKSLNKETKMI